MMTSYPGDYYISLPELLVLTEFIMRLLFPHKGIDKGRALAQQPSNTSPDMNNMRFFDTLDNRARGGQRPGLDKWGNGDRIGGVEQPVVAMCVVSSVV